MLIKKKSLFNQDGSLCRGGECQREQAQLLSEKSNIDCRDKCPAYSLMCPRGCSIMPLTLALLIGLKMACYWEKNDWENYHDYCLSTMLAPRDEVVKWLSWLWKMSKSGNAVCFEANSCFDWLIVFLRSNEWDIKQLHSVPHSLSYSGSMKWD